MYISKKFCHTLIRECQEELGADVLLGSLLFVSENLYMHEDFQDFVSLHIYYAITLCTEVDYALHGAQWFAVDALPVDEMLPIDRDFMQKCSLQTISFLSGIYT